jgi:uncharacterized protein (TIGR02421 family)
VTERITKALVQAIGESLARNRQVRRNLPDGSRLHIDRQLPFLCLYRRPFDREDQGSERLLLGEAAYLLATSQERHFAPLQRMIDEITERQRAVFGDFLIFELWSSEVADENRALFHLHLPRHGLAQPLQEKIEAALCKVRLEWVESSVTTTYHTTVHPPHLKPFAQGKKGAAMVIGLEVNPLFRDARTGELFPLELRSLHHELSRALKRIFYHFSHGHTVERPKHYHELGRRAMTQAVRECDRRLAAISSRFDLLLHVTPVNVSQAWQQFRRRHYAQIPQFHYRSRTIDPSLAKRELFSIPIERIEDPTLAQIYLQKQRELDRQISLVADRNTPNFLYGSRQLFGDLETSLLRQAKKMLAQIPPHSRDDQRGDLLSVKQFAAMAQRELEHLRRQDRSFKAQVEVRDDITGILVSKGNFLISRDARVPKLRAEAALAHEIGTHVLTYHNGRQQPLHEFYTGMTNYEPMQEGLAVLAEYLVGGLSRPRLRLLAGRVLAVDQIHRGADFVESYRALHDKYAFSQYEAFTIAMRVYRGGGYTKDAVYLRGLLAVMQLLAEGRELEELLLGKVSLEQLPLVEELRWRKVLRRGTLKPRYLEEPGVQQRLERLRSGLSVSELLMEAG